MQISRRSTVHGRGRFVAGRFVLPATRSNALEVRSPADPSDLLGVFPLSDDDADDALTAATAAAARWGATSLDERLATVATLATPLAARTQELTARLHREQGRPLWECAREVRGLVGRLQDFVANARGLVAERRPHPRARIASRPFGVVAVIGPAMLPLGTSHGHILAAIVAGNSVVWKPSPLAASSAQLFTEVLQAGGLPVGVFNMVQGDADAAGRLVDDARVAAVVFAGRSEHGAELAARRPRARVILHLGAKNPAVVLDDADVEAAAHDVAQAAFLSAGQRCTALSRALVARPLLERFVAAVVAETRALPVGARERDAFVGPMLSAERCERFCARLPPDGAETILGGERRGPGWFVTPSIHLVGDTARARDYLEEELFGPDLAIEAVDGLDEAIDRCNEAPSGLCAAVWTRSELSWRRFGERVEAGALFHDRPPHSASGRVSFAGYKTSGSGEVNGVEAILALRRPVALFEREQREGRDEAMVAARGRRCDG